MTTLELAYSYIARGWTPLPIPARQKAPIIRDWPNYKPRDADFNNGCNIGVILGEPSGNLVDIDLDAPEAATLAPMFLPDTQAVFGRPGKPRSHRLYTCKTITQKFVEPGRTTILELRSTGGQTVLPGSIHPSGEPIVWDADGPPATADPHELVRRCSLLAAAAMLARHWPTEGARHDMAMALAGGLLRHGWDANHVRRFIAAVAQAAGDDEIEDRTAAVNTTAKRLEAHETVVGWPRLKEMLPHPIVNRFTQWIGTPHAAEQNAPAAENTALAEPTRNSPGFPDPVESARQGRHWPLTDIGNAERFAFHYRNRVRFCVVFGKWFVWDGKRWEIDNCKAADRLAMQTAKRIRDEERVAQHDDDNNAASALAKHALKSQAHQRLTAMLALGAAQDGICIQPDELDRDPWLFNVENGTIDLRNGYIRQHDPNNHCTKLAPVTFDPYAQCPQFLAFLETIMPANPETLAFLQSFLGYCLSGDVGEQIFPIWHGEGGNGKGVLMETMLGIMGPYACKCASDMLVHKRNESHPTEIADLLGKRLVFASETEESRRLKTALVKELTGDNRLKARFMRQDFFEFNRTHKTVLITNNKPVIRENKAAVWRRVLLVPFAVEIPRNHQIARFDQILQAEWPGILTWLVSGAVAWWKSKAIAIPESVAAATAYYRDEEDVFGHFTEECLTLDPVATTPAAAIWAAWAAWSDRHNERMGRDEFARSVGRLVNRPRAEQTWCNGRNQRCWRGIRVNS